jgi:hypothetical protein
MGFWEFWKESVCEAGLSAFGLVGTADIVISLSVALIHDFLRKNGPPWIKNRLKHRWFDKWALPIIFLVWFGLATLIFAPFWQYTKLERAHTELLKKTEIIADLKVSFIDYGYESSSHELIAVVQVDNAGKVRRTVLGALFTHRLNGETRYLVNSIEELHARQTPRYVEPNQPVTVIYKHGLDDETLLTTPGVVFGLEFMTIGPDGSKNYTSVEVMRVDSMSGVQTQSGKPAIGWLTARQTNISMDEVGGHTTLADRPMLPSPPPNKEGSPH